MDPPLHWGPVSGTGVLWGIEGEGVLGWSTEAEFPQSSHNIVHLSGIFYFHNPVEAIHFTLDFPKGTGTQKSPILLQ